MKTRHSRALAALILLGSLVLSSQARALTISDDAVGSSQPTPVSFPPAPGTLVNGDFLLEPNPGCTGPATNCGLTGDGINDQTTWIFDFRSDPDFASFRTGGPLTSATLSLTLTVKETQINTDLVRIRGLADITAQIQDLLVGQTATISFDLLDFYTSSQILENLDATLIAGSLPKNAGELLMLYQDDAILSNAQLSLSNDVPEPALAALLLGGLALLSARRNQRRAR